MITSLADSISQMTIPEVSKNPFEGWKSGLRIHNGVATLYTPKDITFKTGKKFREDERYPKRKEFLDSMRKSGRRTREYFSIDNIYDEDGSLDEGLGYNINKIIRKIAESIVDNPVNKYKEYYLQIRAPEEDDYWKTRKVKKEVQDIVSLWMDHHSGQIEGQKNMIKTLKKDGCKNIVVTDYEEHMYNDSKFAWKMKKIPKIKVVFEEKGF